LLPLVRCFHYLKMQVCLLLPLYTLPVNIYNIPSPLFVIFKQNSI